MSNTEKATYSTYGNIWVREMVFIKAGDTKKGHKHKFDHLHYLTKGSIKITSKSDEVSIINTAIYEAPAWIKVPKEVFHEIEALEPMTIGCCIQALRDEDGEIMDTSYSNDLLKDVDNCSNPLESTL